MKKYNIKTTLSKIKGKLSKLEVAVLRDSQNGVVPFSLNEIEELLNFQYQFLPDEIKLVKNGFVLGKGNYLFKENKRRLNLDSIKRQFENGYTIKLIGLERFSRYLRSLHSDCVSMFSLPVGINAYLTPKEARGYDFHKDDHHVIIFQLYGSKHWDIRDSNSEKINKKILLNTGDVLIIPAGVNHRSQSGLDMSLHITLGIYEINLIDFFVWAVSEGFITKQALFIENRESKNKFGKEIADLLDNKSLLSSFLKNHVMYKEKRVSYEKD